MKFIRHASRQNNQIMLKMTGHHLLITTLTDSNQKKHKSEELSFPINLNFNLIFKEAELQNKYQEGINYLNGGNFERATSIFTSILTHPIMQKYHVTNWEAFDKGELIEPHKIASNMAKIYFNVNLFMACIAETPTPFYIQVKDSPSIPLIS
jgi:hypothetical protein